MKHDWKRTVSENIVPDSSFVLKLYDWECRFCGGVITTTSCDKHTVDLLEKQVCPYYEIKKIMES
jgi:hypothetical protein